MEKDFIKNVADKEQVKSAAFKEKRKREQELKDVSDVLMSPHGRRFVWRYLEKCGVYRSSYTGNSQTFFLEGERNIGLQLMTDIMDANPELYLKLVRENRRREDG
jgi:hypothetical protein